MKTRILTFVVVLCVGLGLLVVEGFSATNDSRKMLKAKKRAILDETQIISPKAIDMYRYLSGKYVGCEDIDPERGTIVEHAVVGNTWRDYQSNSTIGRRMGVMYQNAFRHFVWSYMAGPDYSTRYVYANCYDPWTPFWTGPSPIDGGPNKGSAYAYIQLMEYDPADNNRKEIPAASYHNYEGDPRWYTCLSIDDDECEGGWSRHWDVPDWVAGDATGGIWPRCKVVHAPLTETTGRDYFHIVVNEAATLYRIGWVRCYINASDQLITETYHNGYKMYTSNEGVLDAGPLAHPIALVDTVCFIDPVVETSPVSNRVAIVYTSAVADDHANETDGCDVGYVESMYNGEDWLSGIPFVFYNITNYPGGCTDIVERAFIDLGACYDYEDSLHIVYITTYVPCPAGGSYYPQYAWAYHWSKKTGNKMIQYLEETEDIHHQNEAGISKICISAKDPIYHPDEGTYLFCTWTQVDSADRSATGFGNRDIFACASSDGGNSWAKVWNLTQTNTDQCLAGDCVSEGWASLAQNMYNGDLHIQYICDRDAGPCVWDEGVWTDNEVWYLDMEEWMIGTYPELYYRIEEPPNPPNWTKPPLKVPAGDRDVLLKVFNVGNAPLVFSVTDDEPVCIETPATPDELNPGDSATVTITLKGSGGCQNTFVDGNVIIITNDPENPETYLPIQAVVADDYYECPLDEDTYDTLINDYLKLYVNANGQEWIHDIGTYPDTAHEVFFNGGTIVATTREGDTLVGRYMGYNDQHAGAREKLYLFENSDFWVVSSWNTFMHDLEPPADYKWYWWEISTEIVFFNSNASEDLQHCVTKYVTMQRHDPPTWWPDQSPFSGYEDTYIGIAMDIDCPYDSSGFETADEFACNEGGYDAINEIAWQRGFGRAGEHPEYSNYYCGIALVNGGYGAEGIEPYGSYCVKNNTYLYPQSPWGWKDGELYELAATAGNSIQDPDSLLDRSYVFTARKIYADFDPDAQASFTVLMVVAPEGLAKLKERVVQGRTIATGPKITYKDATSPKGIPDFAQRGTCWRTAVANCLWYWDHHGFATLFPHSAGDPGDWKEDSKAVIDQLSKLVQEKGWTNAVPQYIKSKGKHWVFLWQSGLKVKEYTGRKAKYSLFKKELARCQDVIPYFKAHETGAAEGVWLKIGDEQHRHEWYHAQTAAGWDNATPPTRVVTTNGWNGDNVNVVDKDNYEISTIQDPSANGDKLRITHNPVNGIPPAGSDYIEMTTIMTICPVNWLGCARTVTGTTKRRGGERQMREYSYCLRNYTDVSLENEPVYVLGISLDIPFTFHNLYVQSPPGWTAEEWIPDLTPGLAPPKPFVDPDDPNAMDTTIPDWRGVLWTTTTNPLFPGDTLSGFSFQLPDAFDVGIDASYTAMSSTVLDTSRILDHGFTIGPLFIRGDVNGDGVIDLGDVLYIISYLYKGGPAPQPLDCGDVNCDGLVDLGDVLYLISYLYKGGSPPCEE